MYQLAIDLPHRPALGRADFLVSESNAAALAWIERWPDWPARSLVLCGPAGCGKTHLAALWQARTTARLVAGAALAQFDPAALARAGAVAVDEADDAPERALLHVYNCCVETGASLLVIAREPPARWSLTLPDLASRLRALPCAAIGPPDETLLAAVLIKHFADRQLRVAPEVIGFLVHRIERSFAAAAAVAGWLDRAALGAGRPVTIALARRMLAMSGDQP